MKTIYDNCSNSFITEMTDYICLGMGMFYEDSHAIERDEKKSDTRKQSFNLEQLLDLLELQRRHINMHYPPSGLKKKTKKKQYILI